MAMKKIIFAALLFMGIQGVAFAQTSSSKNSTSLHTGTVSETSPKTHTAKRYRQPKRIHNNRKEYMQNGQLSTYTGHEATPVNTDEFVGIKKHSLKKTKENSN